jgi:hypothetical protein
MIETSNEVPPMSVVMMCFSPIAAPRNIEAVTPATGPESSVSSGASPARATGTVPPPHWAICRPWR